MSQPGKTAVTIILSALAGAAIATLLHPYVFPSDQAAVLPGNPVAAEATPVPSPSPANPSPRPTALPASASAPRQLNAEARAELLAVARNFQKITVSCLKEDAEGFAFASQIKQFLAEKGLAVSGVNEVTRSEPTVGQFAIERGNTVELLIGTNP